MIDTIALVDIIVDAAILGIKQDLRLAFEACEVLVGVSIVGNQTFSSIARTLKREVNHILLRLAVVDGLWSPNPIGIAEMLGIIFF